MLEIPAELRAALEEADALSEVVVLIDPSPEVLEAYTVEERLGVIAVMAGEPEARAAALEAGALEVLDPREPIEARVRLTTAVARFRSRLRLEETGEALDRQSAALERDLRLAARLQRSFLPRLPELERATPRGDALRFASAYLPREFVSGDSYEVRWLDAEHLALYTLDAVGHGVRAALLTVLLRSAFRPLDPATGRPRPPGEVLEELDCVLRDAELAEGPTAAFCYGLFEVTSRRLTVANAGHPLPIRLRAGEATTIGGSGLLLGVQPERYESHEVELAPGDRVFFYTDGAEPGYGATFAGQLASHRDLELMDQLGGALGAAVPLDAEGRPEDDVTVLAMEVGLPATATASALTQDDDQATGS